MMYSLFIFQNALNRRAECTLKFKNGMSMNIFHSFFSLLDKGTARI